MVYEPGEETGKINREWIFAEYATNPDGSRKKVPGTGIQVDRRSRQAISARSFNRPDQRYSLPVSEIRDRRAARAIEEAPESLAVRMDGNRVEVVSKSENRYDVNSADDPNFCACPDFFRLQESYPGEDVACKHILIARIKEAERFPNPLDVGVLWIAEKIGCHYSTVQEACREGIISAKKIKRTWVITEAVAEAFVIEYKARLHDPDFMAWFNQNMPSLVPKKRE